jgi:hypothetical protein
VQTFSLTTRTTTLSKYVFCSSLESEVLEAHALYDFKARSSREVNFHKGDTILLYKQVSNDWWRGAVEGREGLIPDKYIMLKIRYRICQVQYTGLKIYLLIHIKEEMPLICFPFVSCYLQRRGWRT